jgi:hypothetical protein
MINRNQMTPLTKGGARTAHVGKGSQSAPMPNTAMGGPPSFTPSNYSKPTTPAPTSVAPGIGTGQFPGVSGGLT